VGFANWAHEVVAQEQELGLFFDTIIVCVVTGSTQAGMIAGFAEIEDAGGRPRRVIGIDASATLDKTVDQVTRIANTTAERIGLGRRISADEVIIRSGWEGPAYGIPDESTIEAIRTTGEQEGVILDPVYEGKSMAGLFGLIRAGELTADNTVLYAHLGGQLALNAYSSIFED
jgi:1-aminocyclopropane-1-carboxylate deaminase